MYRIHDIGFNHWGCEQNESKPQSINDENDDQEHTLYTQVETHGGGSRKWSGVSSYQVEDDLHGEETHAHGLD